MDWITISKDGKGDRFYPIHQIRQALGATGLTYKEAAQRNRSDFNAANVYFQMCWAREYMELWYTYYKEIAERAKNFWIEFDADGWMNELSRFDTTHSFRPPFAFWKDVVEVGDQIVWECNPEYLPWKNANPINIKLYDEKWQKPVKSKPFDFLFLVDAGAQNAALTMKVAEDLAKTYKVHAIINHKGFYNAYKDHVNFTVHYNGKWEKKHEDYFHQLLDASKVYVELSYRNTLGRNIYEALFHNCICVVPENYGAAQLFRKYTVQTHMPNYDSVVDACKRARKDVDVLGVELYVKHAKKHFHIRQFVNELEDRSR